jgi:hypothetical protein
MIFPRLKLNSVKEKFESRIIPKIAKRSERNMVFVIFSFIRKSANIGVNITYNPVINALLEGVVYLRPIVWVTYATHSRKPRKNSRKNVFKFVFLIPLIKKGKQITAAGRNL